MHWSLELLQQRKMKSDKYLWWKFYLQIRIATSALWGIFSFISVKKVNKTFHLRLSFAARLSGREGKESIISKSNIWAHRRFVIRCVSRSLRQTKKDSHRRRDYGKHLNLNCCHFPFEWVFMPAFSSSTSFNRLYRSPLWVYTACLAVM